jgi:uncharacterized protein YcfJ
MTISTISDAAIHKRICLLMAGGLFMLSMSAQAVAGEFQVDAPVVNVETLTGPDRIVQVCPEKPAGGLAETLRWDLGVSCTSKRIPTTEISGYRVFYRWDNRVYSHVMDRRPGATIPLTVSLD